MEASQSITRVRDAAEDRAEIMLGIVLALQAAAVVLHLAGALS